MKWLWSAQFTPSLRLGRVQTQQPRNPYLLLKLKSLKCQIRRVKLVCVLARSAGV